MFVPPIPKKSKKQSLIRFFYLLLRKMKVTMANNTIKIIQSLLFLANHQKNKKMDFMKAYKLLWLADRCHLRMYGRTITGDKYFALPHGIVPTDAKHLLEGEATMLNNPESYFDSRITITGKHTFQAVAEPDKKEFSESDIYVLSSILSQYNHLEPKELSELSHKYPEWKKYEGMLNDKSSRNSFPVNMDLFFENCAEDNAELFNQDSELLETSKELYHEYCR